MPTVFGQIIIFTGSILFAQSLAAEPLADRILSNTMATQYKQAMVQAESLSTTEPERACFYRTMVLLSRFDDLGDLADLTKAKSIVEACKPSPPFFECLRLFQLGYIEAESGSNLSAALTTRKAAKGFQQIGTLEARGFFAIYAYYMEVATAWIPFRTDHRNALLQTLDSARLSSTRFWPLYSTSLVWMHFDQQQYGKALAITDWALAKYPGHPVYLQMRGDMLYRLKRYQEAAVVYEQSFRTYSQRAMQSIRWWCAAGNLIRIYAALGDTTKVSEYQQFFARASFEKVRKRMPPSLMDALEDADLLP